MKKLLIPLLIASVAANAYLFWGADEVKADEQKSTSLESEKEVKHVSEQMLEQLSAETGLDKDGIIQELSDKLKNIRDQLAKLENENKSLQEQLEDMRLAKEALANNTLTEVAESANNPSDTNGEEGKTIEEMQQEQKNQRAIYKNEQIDQGWAYPTQDSLNDVIADSKLLATMSVNDVTCKATSCRVSVTPLQDTMGGKIGAYFEFSQVLHESDGFKNYQSSSHHDDDSNDVYIYFTRPESGS